VHLQLSGNLIYANGRAGIGITPYNYYGSNSTIEIYNNTLFDNCTSGRSYNGNPYGEIFIRPECTNTTVTVKNNLLFHNSYENTMPLSYSAASNFPSGTFIHQNNLYYNTAGAAAKLVDVNGTNDYTASNITNWESTAQTGDPFLMNTNQLPTETTLAGGTSPDGLAVQPWP
jgi:hypothetical protein